MRHSFRLAGMLAVCFAVAPSSAFAWGAVGHRFIMTKVIELLPPEIKPFFEANRDELVLRSNDPDLWRVAGFEEDVPNHQLDLGVTDYGPYPFEALPREYGAAIEKFGIATVRRHGTLPWRIEEEFGNLRRVMASFATGFAYAGGNTVLFAAVLSHYLADATQPFHLYNNYDGQMTGQFGIHSRFESELLERYLPRMSIKPAPATVLRDVNGEIWKVVLTSFQDNAAILAADKAAIAGKDTYDDQYFEAFFAKTQPILERQLATAITETASFILTAWDRAGRPTLVSAVPRPTQKVRQPR